MGFSSMAISFLFSFAYAYVCKRVKWYDTIRALLHKLLIFATGSFNIGTNKLREIMFMLSFCSHVGDFFLIKGYTINYRKAFHVYWVTWRNKKSPSKNAQKTYLRKTIWIAKKVAIKIMDKTDIKICWIIIKKKDRDKFINYRKLSIKMQ